MRRVAREVTVLRSRISHNQDGTMEIPSATAWNTSHQLAITQNLRDAVCDQMSDESAGKSRADVCQQAGDESLLGRSPVIDIVHQEGEQLEWEQTQAEWIATGFPGCEPAYPVATDKPRGGRRTRDRRA